MKPLFCLIFLGSTLVTAAPSTCPAPITSAIEKRFPKSTVQTCKAEREHDKDQYEVVLTTAGGGRVEVDLSATGDILQTEEVVTVDKVPAAVMKAFATKYPKAKATRAEKQTPATGKVSYELAFEASGKRKEATFNEDGVFVEEE